MDILCQAESGMGKTAVFVLATLQQIEPVGGQVCTDLFYSKDLLFKTIRLKSSSFKLFKLFY